MKPPVHVRWHQGEGFAGNMHDDEWLAVVGKAHWVVLSQDRKFHLLDNELQAIKQHSIRCFYMPHANDDRWQSLCTFTARYRKIIEIVGAGAGPFVYELKANGRFYKVKL